MAHEIDMTTGKAAVFVTGEPAWHKLGTVIKEAATSAEAIKLAVLDWVVEKKPLFTEGGAKVPGVFATVRKDTGGVLGTVGSNYRPFQNLEAFDFMDALVGEKLAMFETAGSLREGKRVWMLARIPKVLRAAGDDVIHPYVLLTNSHDATSSLRMLPTTVRVVCQNTLNLALSRSIGGRLGLAIRHSRNMQVRVDEARQKLGIVLQRVDEFGEQAQMLASKKLKTASIGDYFKLLVEGSSEKMQDKMLGYFWGNLDNSRNSLPAIKGTLWAAYNAVSEYADHQSTVRNGLDGRLNSIWFGTANDLKQKAFDTALQLAMAS